MSSPVPMNASDSPVGAEALALIERYRVLAEIASHYTYVYLVAAEGGGKEKFFEMLEQEGLDVAVVPIGLANRSHPNSAMRCLL